MSDLFGLWPHQEEGVAAIEKAWSEGFKSVCFQLSTGGGKSRIIRTITDNHSSSKKKIYLIAHRQQLINQLSDEISEAGIKHGLIMAGHPHINYRVQVCSIQTLIKRIDKLDEPDLIIYDEFHHAKSKSSIAVFKKWPRAKLLGLTATPRRTDGSPLSDICEKLIIGPSMRSLMDDGYLSDYEYFAPDDVSMEGARRSHGDYVRSEAEGRVDKAVITGSAVEHYRKYADRKPAIACCISISHSEHVAQQFSEAGYRARAVQSKMDKREIQRCINGLKDGTLDILCQCDLIGEGVDIKGAVCLIGLRPTQSLIIFLQQCGRVLRAADGKDKAIILDHVGNWERHGLPDDEREWSLSGKIKQSEQSRLKRCPDCLRPVPVSTRKCPHCGYLWAEREDQGERIPKEKEGQLVSIKTISKIDRNDLVIKIAREARDLRAAILIAKKNGVDHRGAYHIWTHDLNNKVDKKAVNA